MKLSNSISCLRTRFEETSVDNILWWINLSPKWAGISILTHDNSVPFWIIHFSLLFYMDFFSNVAYRIILSEDLDGVIKANTNLSLVILTVNINVWYFRKRSLLLSTIKKVHGIDQICSQTGLLNDKYKLLLKRVKLFVLAYYSINLINIFFLWLPLRMDISGSLYTDSPCPGLNVTKEINKHICRAIIYFQDVTVTIVVINYQSLMLFFIAYAAAMFIFLADEFLELNNVEDSVSSRAQVKERLAVLIKRHILLLDMVQCLKSLYNMPIGIDFGANAFCICLFFTLPLQDWIAFGPLLGYCLMVFFLYCLLCQKLIDASKIFADSVYGCGWEKFELSDQKTVYILYKLAQQPIVLLAAHIIPININTFATTVQCIYKFVTALKV